jgi:hypothetical protein
LEIGSERKSITLNVTNLPPSTTTTYSEDYTTDDENSMPEDLDAVYQLEICRSFSAAELELLRRCASSGDNLGVIPEIDYWELQGLRELASQHCILKFNENQRFTLTVNTDFIARVELSEQLSFILSFLDTRFSCCSSAAGVNSEEDNSAESTILSPEPLTASSMRVWEAKFMPDLTGGISTLYVYAPGLIEPVIVGDQCAPLLRVAIVRGQPGEMIEDTYVGIQYHRLLTKEVSEIQVEIRSATGQLMPFQYGNCILSLHFRKTPYF